MTPSRSEHTVGDPYAKGHAAATRGQTAVANPHPPDTEAAELWAMGHEDGTAELKGNQDRKQD